MSDNTNKADVSRRRVTTIPDLLNQSESWGHIVSTNTGDDNAQRGLNNNVFANPTSSSAIKPLKSTEAAKRHRAKRHRLDLRLCVGCEVEMMDGWIN